MQTLFEGMAVGIMEHCDRSRRIRYSARCFVASSTTKRGFAFGVLMMRRGA